MIRHTKRITSPTYWGAGRKNFKWITSVRPGPHPARHSIPLQVLLRDILGLVETARESKAVIKSGKVIVDGVARKDHKFPVGLMDVVSLPLIKKYYRIVPYENGLKVIEIPKKEADIKLVKVIRKQIVGGGKTQITASDGRNYSYSKAKIGDTLVIKGEKIAEKLSMKKGQLCLITRGKQAGRMGKLVRLDKVSRLEGNKDLFEVPLEYIMVVGESKSMVKLYETAKD